MTSSHVSSDGACLPPQKQEVKNRRIMTILRLFIYYKIGYKNTQIAIIGIKRRGIRKYFGIFV